MSRNQDFFEKVHIEGMELRRRLEEPQPLADLLSVLKALDYIHTKACLLEAYHPGYPLVEARELIPSFDAPMIEYQDLPAFSLVVLDRQLSYQDEGFQFDELKFEGNPPSPSVVAANRALLKDRVPRNLASEVDRVLGRRALTPLGRYSELLPLLTHMDRGHVLARGEEGCYRLAGVFASFPSDLDGEIKRFGRKIGKFQPGDNDIYAANRHFVYRFFMEQSGFPICGERHTSAALFARRLLRRRESFAVKVLGTSDRTITTLSSLGAYHGMPAVDKIALVAVPADEKEAIGKLRRGGYFVDVKRRVVILRVRYTNHRYHADNVLEERALSVASQEVIHPVTGRVREDLDILGLSQDRLLALNDIVRGEFKGCILYRSREQVEGTAGAADRLRFLAAWLQKHHNILADYSPDNFKRLLKILNSYLEDESRQEEFQRYGELHHEVKNTVSGLRYYHRLRLLEKLVRTRSDASGRRLQHTQILTILVHVLGQEGERLIGHHPRVFTKLLQICQSQLDNRYLKRRYLSHPPQSSVERETVGQYRLLEALVGRLKQLAAAHAANQGFSLEYQKAIG